MYILHVYIIRSIIVHVCLYSFLLTCIEYIFALRLFMKEEPRHVLQVGLMSIEINVMYLFTEKYYPFFLIRANCLAIDFLLIYLARLICWRSKISRTLASNCFFIHVNNFRRTLLIQPPFKGHKPKSWIRFFSSITLQNRNKIFTVE